MPRPANPKFSVNYFNMTGEDLWNHYEGCLKYHDWFFNYADDPTCHRLGKEERRYLNAFYAAIRKFDEKRATELFEKYRPKA